MIVINLNDWNPVYRFVMKVKYDYVDTFGKIDFDNHGDLNFFEHWVAMLNNPEYTEKIQWLELNTNGSLLLIRYASYSDVYNAETEMTLDELWKIDDGFYQECRSIVIDMDKDEIVLCPFKKFRNLNECEENSLENIRREIENAHSFEITEKLDGSMQSATWYDNRLVVAGSQAIDPEKSWRLQDGISMLQQNPKYIDMISAYPQFTFIFEYISLKDAHVVKYKKEDEGMYLIGIRNKFNGKQLPYRDVIEKAEIYEIPTTTIYNKSFETVLEDIKTIKSSEHEGFVLNIDGHMVKVKGDDYVSIHGIISKISSINLIIKNYADGTLDDLRSKIPTAYRNRVDALEKIINEYVKKENKVVCEFYESAPKDNKRDFMIWVTENVPRKYQGYVRNKFLGIENNYIKHGNSNSPHYKRLCEMGIRREDYASI